MTGLRKGQEIGTKPGLCLDVGWRRGIGERTWLAAFGFHSANLFNTNVCSGSSSVGGLPVPMEVYTAPLYTHNI